MAYESTIVSTTAQVGELRRILLDPTVIGRWPGFDRPQGSGATATTWITSRPVARGFPTGGSWDVEHRVLREDAERPEVLLACASGRSAVHLTAEVWTLSPEVRLVRVGVRHGSAGRLRYTPRKLRKVSQEFGKAIAAAAGGEVLERVGMETVQRLGILGPPEGAESADPPARDDTDEGAW